MSLDGIGMRNIQMSGMVPISNVLKLSIKPETKRKAHAGINTQESVDINKDLFKTASKTDNSVKAEDKSDNYSKTLRNDSKMLMDGYDSSRDMVGVAFKEGKAEEPYKFRVDLKHLKIGAEVGNLDVYTLLNVGKNTGNTGLPDGIPGTTAMPWNIAVAAYDNKASKTVDENMNTVPNAVSGLKFNAMNNCVEFNVDKEVLRAKGWKDGQPLKLQVFTAKDFVKQVTDSLDEPNKKPWLNNDQLSRYIDTGKPDSLHPKRDSNWGDDVIYFIMTDRFEDGDKTNNMGVDKNDLKKRWGGDLQGIINRMDYLKDLGVSTLWITPVVDNQDEFIDSAGYHGYWPVNFEKVDEHLGDMDKFKEMINTAHEKGMKVVLDIPLNHTAWGHPWRDDPSKKDWFHHIGEIKDWDDPYQIENGSMYGLPDLAQENPQVYNYLLENCKMWIDTGIDGFRQDAVMHINKDFWAKFNKDIKDYAGPDFFIVGEVFHGDPNKVAQYQKEGMPSLFDLPLYFTAKDTFAHDGSMKNLANKLAELENAYEDPAMMTALIDNHDTARFMTEAGHNSRDKLKLALAFLFSVNRIPSIYYGTESAMSGREEAMGSHGPENRAPMQFYSDPDMHKYVTNLLHARNGSEALKNGALLEMWKDDQIFAYARTTPDDDAVVVLNNSYSDQYREIPIRPESGIKNGDVLKDAITGWEVTVTDNKLKLQLGKKQPAVFLKK